MITAIDRCIQVHVTNGPPFVIYRVNAACYVLRGRHDERDYFNDLEGVIRQALYRTGTPDVEGNRLRCELEEMFG